MEQQTPPEQRYLTFRERSYVAQNALAAITANALPALTAYLTGDLSLEQYEEYMGGIEFEFAEVMKNDLSAIALGNLIQEAKGYRQDLQSLIEQNKKGVTTDGDA